MFAEDVMAKKNKTVFVCQECGSVIDLDMAPIDEKLNEIASENFPGEITQNVVYFKGICKNCLKKH